LFWPQRTGVCLLLLTALGLMGGDWRKGLNFLLPGTYIFVSIAPLSLGKAYNEPFRLMF
jgi:hypothetical protein